MIDLWNLPTETCPVEVSTEATSPLAAFASQAEHPAIPSISEWKGTLSQALERASSGLGDVKFVLPNSTGPGGKGAMTAQEVVKLHASIGLSDQDRDYAVGDSRTIYKKGAPILVAVEASDPKGNGFSRTVESVPIALEQTSATRPSPPAAALNTTSKAAAPSPASTVPSSRLAPPFEQNLKHENHLWLAPGASPEFGKEVNEALTYLKQSPTAAKLISDIAHGPADVFIQESSVPVPPAYFEPSTRTVHFNPCMGALWSNKSMAKPAMILLHELGHAKEFVYNPAERQRAKETRVPGYPDGEEKRNFLKVEAPVSKELGEPMRDGPSKPIPVPCSRDAT